MFSPILFPWLLFWARNRATLNIIFKDFSRVQRLTRCSGRRKKTNKMDSSSKNIAWLARHDNRPLPRYFTPRRVMCSWLPRHPAPRGREGLPAAWRSGTRRHTAAVREDRLMPCRGLKKSVFYCCEVGINLKLLNCKKNNMRVGQQKRKYAGFMV